MGATTFITRASGKNASEAFDNAIRGAQYAHGHSGYTGTIAEKDEFVTIPLPESRVPREYANELINKGDPRINNKWGPAGCIVLGNDEYLFFGWASE